MADISDVLEMISSFELIGLRNGPDLSSREKKIAVATAWSRAMSDVAPSDLQTAAEKWIELSPFWPAPAEVRKLCPTIHRASLALETADPTTGRDRWPSIVRAAGSLGRSCADWPEKLAARIGVQDVDRLKRAIDDAGGWINLCNCDHDAQRAAMGRRFAASWDRQARAMFAQSAPERALEGDRMRAGGVVDLAAEVKRRRALEGSGGRNG